MFPTIDTNDSINPVLYKELRQMRNSALPWLATGGMLLIEVLTVLALFIFTGNASDKLDKFDLDGVKFILGASVFLSTLLILVSAFPTIHLTTLQRKVDGSDPLLGTCMSAWQVIWGKLQAIFYMDVLLLICMLPLLLFAAIHYNTFNLTNFCHCLLGILTLQTCMLSLSCYQLECFNFSYHWLPVMILGCLPLVILPACLSFDDQIIYTMQCVYISVCISLIALALCQAYAFLQHPQRDRDTPMRICILLLTPIWLIITYFNFVKPKMADTGITQHFDYEAFIHGWAAPISFALMCYMIWCSFGDFMSTRRIRNELLKDQWLMRAIRLPFVSGAINGIIFSACLMLSIDVVLLLIQANIPAPVNNNTLCEAIVANACIAEPPWYDNTLNNMKCFVEILFAWLQYGLFYSGIILFVREHCSRRFITNVLMGTAIPLVGVSVPLAEILDIPKLCYFSPLYANFLVNAADKAHSAWEIQFQILPLLVTALVLLYKPCKNYFAALKR